MLWKTMPGRVKQVPQDSTEWNWMDTVHSTDKHLRVWSRYKLLFWTPLVISCKKYIYWKLFIFIRVWHTSSILVTPDFEHKWFIRASWPTGFLDRGPRPVVSSCRGGLQKCPNHTVKNQIVQKLPQKIMVLVRRLIMGSAASSETPYEDLKAKLVSSYTLSRWQKVSKLIHHPGLGDRRPTALMDAMLAPVQEDEKPGCLFQGLFLERLPIEMRDV